MLMACLSFVWFLAFRRCSVFVCVRSVCPFVSVTLMSDRSLCGVARAGVLRFRIYYALAFPNLIDTPKMTWTAFPS